ncbi:MAG: TolC family protein [Rikenellaceae bacterium]|nr:TolC family protein [Rikenellaceae bacterium]
MKRYPLLLLVGAFLFPLVATAQTTGTDTLRLTLEDCLFYALDHNYNRQVRMLNEAAAEENIEQARKNRLPNLSATVSETLSDSKDNHGSWNGNYGVSTGATLYQGGNLKETIRLNELRRELTYLQTDQYDNELIIQILQSFLTALGNEELLRYQRFVLEASEEQRRQGRELFAAGEMIESDYLLLEAQYASDRNNLLETEIGLENSLSSLKILLSLDPQEPMRIVYPDTAAIRSMLILPSEDYVLDRSLESLPELRISDFNVEIAESGVRISRSSFFPTVSLSGSVGTGHVNTFSRYGNQLSDRLNEQVGVSVSIPIFNRGQTRSNVTQSRIALQQAELSRMQTELEIRNTVVQEYRDVVTAGNRFLASEIRQEAYFQSFEAYRAMFEVSAITTVELLQQQNNYISALNDYIQSKYGFLLIRSILDVYMGEPLSIL